MFFSSDCKKELCRLPLGKNCCALAELSGLYTTMGSMNLLGRGRVSVQFTGESMAVSRRVYTIITKTLGLSPQIHYTDHARFGGRRSCVITLGPMDSPQLLLTLNMARLSEGALTLISPVPKAAITRLCCMKAYLRGLFLGGGTIASPESECHIELPCREAESKQTAARCVQRLSLPIHYSTRHGREYMYWKRLEQAAELLRQMGAAQSAKQLEETHVRKQIYTRAARSTRCDSANVKRTVAAGDKQLELIRQLEERGLLPTLPPALQEMARIRLSAPEANLAELGEMFTPPLSKSGVNNRMRRLCSLAQTEKINNSSAGGIAP